jgi:hypothetical protein
VAQTLVCGAIEVAFADDVRYLEAEIGVPFRSSGALRDTVTRVIAPSGHGFVILPIDLRKALAVVGFEGFEFDEAGHFLRRREHLRGHLGIIIAGFGSQAGTKNDNDHN